MNTLPSSLLAPRTSLAEILRGDRLLAWMTLILSAVVLVPLFATRIVPDVDLGGHLALAGAIPGILSGDPVASEYAITPYPMPYSLVYLVLAPLSVVSPFLAAKVLIAIAVLLLPLALMRFSAAIGRDPRLGIAGFLIAWDSNVQWGFVAFSIGVSIAFFLLARLAEATNAREALRCWPLAVMLAFTHAQAAALFLGAAVFLAFAWPDVRARLKLHVLGTLGLWAGLTPWVLGGLFVKGVGVKSKYEFYWPPIGKRVNELFLQSIDLVPGDTGRTATGLAFLALLLAPAVLTLLPRREGAPEGRRLAQLVGYLVLLYWLLPYSIAFPIPQTLVHLRHATLALWAPIWLPAVTITGRLAERVLLPIVVVLVVFTAAAKADRFAAWDREIAPFSEVVSKIGQPSRIAVFVRHQGSSSAVLAPYLHIGGWVAAATKSFDGTTWNTPKLPVYHRNRLGLPELDLRDEASFDVAKHGAFYDWVLLLADDASTSALAKQPEALEPVYSRGIWHLYRVHRSGL